MACIKIKDFAEKHNMRVKQVYELLRHNKHLKKRVPGLGVLVDEKKYEKLIA